MTSSSPNTAPRIIYIPIMTRNDMDVSMIERFGAQFDRAGLVRDIKASATIADWAYHCAFAAGAETFRSRGMFERLRANWRDALSG